MKPLVLLVAGLILIGGLPPMPAIPWPAPPTPAPAPAPATKATSVAYVYEKDQTAPPVGVTVALNRLNRDRGIMATLVEADAVDGTGQVPAQYRTAIEAARRDGLPALVVLSGSTVIGIVKAPTDPDAIARAVP